MRLENKGSPLISIILCVYNRRNTVIKALDSIINQTFKDYEVIIVDDGSTDNVEELIIPYIKQKDKFKYIRHSNRHIAYSKNTGLLIALGSYVTFLDSDDQYKEKHLENMVNLINKNPDLDFVYSDPVIVGNKEDEWFVNALDSTKLIHVSNCVFGATFFGRKKIFLEMNGFVDMPYAEDFDFFGRLVSAGKYKILKSDEKTYVYFRDIKDSITNVAKSMHCTMNSFSTGK
jgi:glycosyltransferase involved in cell wall biosynthesis